jgi:hypothetical protein
VGQSLYQSAPEPRLDQTPTIGAINAYQQFLDLHPDSRLRSTAQKRLYELQDKLIQKEYLSAELYYNLGGYFGNVNSNNESNYISCIITAQNALKTYPYNQWRELKKFFDRHGTVLESWYPLGGRDRYGRSGFAMLAADPVIVDLAKKHGKSTAQIILRWHLQDGNIAIPRSSNPAHIKENLDIFNFQLDAGDMQRMASLDKQQRFSTF